MTRMGRPPGPPRFCTVPGCDRKHWGFDFCRSHGRAFKLYGDPLGARVYGVKGCSVEGCTNPHDARGLCHIHYERKRRTGTLETSYRTGCSVDGCDRPHDALGWCSVHYRRYRRHGDPAALKRRPLPDVCEIPGCAGKPHARGLCQSHYEFKRSVERATVRFPALPAISVAPLVEIIEHRSKARSLGEIAAAFGIEVRTIHRWRSGESKTLRRADAEDICDRIGIHPASLWDEWIVCKHGRPKCSDCKIGVAA